MTNFSLKTNGFRVTSLIRGVAAAAVVMGLTTVGPVQAATPPAHMGGMSKGMTQSSPRAKFEQTRMELMRAEQQLAHIQSKTLKDHPELLKKQKHFMALMTKEMKSNGHDPKKDMADLRSLEGKLRSKSTSGADRQKLTKQFEQKLTAFQKARAEAMKSPKLQKARANLSNAVLTAMKKENPKTDDLLRTVNQKRQQLMQMHRSAMGAGGTSQGKAGK
ncbi:MAG: hypothetical protein P8124_01480 [Gammaproteobacteria bacterium]